MRELLGSTIGAGDTAFTKAKMLVNNVFFSICLQGGEDFTRIADELKTNAVQTLSQSPNQDIWNISSRTYKFEILKHNGRLLDVTTTSDKWPYSIDGGFKFVLDKKIRIKDIVKRVWLTGDAGMELNWNSVICV